MKQVKQALFFAAMILGTALILRHTERLGLYTFADERLRGVMIGFILMWFGNIMPKKAPEATCAECSASAAQNMRCFAGWTFVAAGLAHSASWLFAPIEQADLLAMSAVGIAMLVVVSRAFLTRAWV